jgi:hypothetical protein
MTETATQSPAEIDAQLAALYAKFDAAAAVMMSESKRITDTQRDAAAVEADRLGELITPLANEFVRRGGWTRYYLVEGGHLHRNASAWDCSRTSSTSQYWMTDLSGMSETEVIELAGDRVCTVCYPAAPVAVLGRPSKLLTKSEAERAQAAADRAAARDTKAAKAAAAAITALDGTPLQGFIDVIRTEREAITEYRETVAELTALADTAAHLRFRAKHMTEAEHLADRDRLVAMKAPIAKRLLQALAAKHGVTEAEEYDAHIKPVAAKVRRNAKEAERFRQINAHFYAEA